MSKYLIIALLGAMALASCASSPGNTARNRTRNLPGANQPMDKLTARIKVYHTNADTSRIYFTLDTRSQDYYLLADKRKFRAEYLLGYEITKTDNGKKILADSSILKLVDMQPAAQSKTITAYIETPIALNFPYAIKLNIVNSRKNARFDYYARFTKNNCTGAENVLVSSDDGVPLLEKNFVYTSGVIRLRKECDQRPELYKVTGGQALPTPPFATDDFGTQNNYDRELVALELKGPNQYQFSNLGMGMYTIQTDEKTGIVFHHFTRWYPYCNDTAGFYQPLIYICSRAEYALLDDETNVKQDFENFWVERAGNKEQARKAINEYYKRVFDANIDYTSVQEGWRTDRGMVYIIFGKPSYVEKQLNRETWIYRTAFNTSLTYTFHKIDNPYSDNDYRLERDLRYKPQWYNALENWRAGRPFSLVGY